MIHPLILKDTRLAFHPRYLALAFVLLLVEIAIARGIIPGEFVRNSLGDVLAVALLYCGLRGVTRCAPLAAASASVALAFAVELLQAFQIVDRLGIERGSVLAIAIGSSFSTLDLLMYAIGGVVALVIDLWVLRKHR